MPTVPNSIRDKLNRLGVKSVEQPSAQDIKLILDAFLRSKELDVEAFNTYVNSISPTLKVVFEGLQQFAESSENITDKTLGIIQNAISILAAELSKDLAQQTRDEIRAQIISLVNDARKESEGHRDLLQKFAYAGAAAALLGFGAAILVITRGKNTAAIAKGAEMAARIL